MGCFALATPLVLFAALQTVRSNSNKVEDWLPSSFAETHELAWFRRHFVADQFVLISWEGCRLGGDPSQPEAEPDDPRIERLANRLVPPAEDAAKAPGEDSGRYFRRVMTGRRVLEQLTAGPAEVPYEAAVERLKGSLIGPDGRQTCVVVTLTPLGVANLRAAIGSGETRMLRRNHAPGELYQAFDACGIPRESVHIGGPSVDNVAIDEEGERTLLRLAGLSGLLGLGLAWLSLRSVRLTLIVFTAGLWSALLGLASVWLSGSTADAVLMSMPALVYVLAVSGAIHVINYYRDAVREGGLRSAPERAVAHAAKPALLCSLTTAIGLLSLYASDLEPIRKFGVYSAVGVFGMLAVLLLLLPAALQLWPPKPRELVPAPDSPMPTPQGPFALTWNQRIWSRVGNTIIRNHAVVAIGCVVVIAAIGSGIQRTETSVDLLKLFDNNARILADYRWLEKHLGRLIPMEIVLRFPPATTATSLSFLERMETVAAVQQSIERNLGAEGRDLVGRTMSAATFAPELPSQAGDTLSFIRRSATSRTMEASREEFERSGFLKVDPVSGEELWRISLRVAAFEDIDFGQFVGDLDAAVAPVLAAHRVRNEVLGELVAQRGSEGVAGATVLLWEAPQSAEESEFAKTLEGFLRRDRLRVVKSTRDPAELPLTTIAKVRRFDSVVLAGTFPTAEAERIQLVGGTVLVADRSSPVGPAALAASSPKVAGEGVEVVYTGVVPIVYKTQRVLLSSLIESAFWSFITITPLMMFVCRGIAAGAVAMLPNVLPVLVVFGGMGWLGRPIDIGSMMAASIALGVAVDDTIHYLTWFRGDLEICGDRRSAILWAYRQCATPTLQAALINGLGLAVFVFSTFTPTRQFGFLMLTILVAGVIAELVMLPALLAGPLGHAFRPAASSRELARGYWRSFIHRVA
nr:MMPL family transporter [Candidatus Laterigemmans baculatus]